MEQAYKERLEQAGVDVSGGIERFMGNEALFEKFFKRFASDTSYSELAEAISAGDCEKAFAAAHTLKGVCGNLSMERLQQAVSRQVEALRSGDLHTAAEIMPEVTAAYEAVAAILSGC